MALKYKNKKRRKSNLIFTGIAIVLIITVFLCMVSHFYRAAEDSAYEDLHVQTKQIKDNMTLQLMSDRENLITMANFASKLHSDGEGYHLLFDSFKSIGLIKNIGILTPDNIFSTKAGSVDLNGKISFQDEVKRGRYISGRVKDLTLPGHEIIRTTVPIQCEGDTVGILYGVIDIDEINNRYSKMAQELDAQLFVFEKESGDLVVDTIQSELGNISFLKDRKYNDGYSYEAFRESDKGYSSFVSALTGENLYLHYSTIDEIGWGIALARYESQVFAEVKYVTQTFFTTFVVMVVIMFLYMLLLISNEKSRNSAITCSSEVRKILLELNPKHDNIIEALKQICTFTKSDSVIFFDTDEEEFRYVNPSCNNDLLSDEDRNYLKATALKYVTKLHHLSQNTLYTMSIAADKHLRKTNSEFYNFLKNKKINNFTFVTVINKNNHMTVLGTINPQNIISAREISEKVAACFSISLFNRKHLSKTEKAATVDSLTGALNRVSYQNDIAKYNAEKPEDFSCVFIDVNELHFINNKYGHAAGDEMLVYISNTLKEVFFGQHVYRIGGDEFLVFIKNTDPKNIKECIRSLNEQIGKMGYHVAVGMAFRSQNTNTEEMVREAEVGMYEEKSLYYQKKEQDDRKDSLKDKYVYTRTGIPEIDTMISVIGEHYTGIYKVNLDSDKMKSILSPQHSENETYFSKMLEKYIENNVNPDYYRAITSFVNYDSLKKQLQNGETPKITYRKTDGESVVITIHKLNTDDKSCNETLWIFSDLK